MNNKNSIAAISALIALSFIKRKKENGNRNIYVLESYKDSLLSSRTRHSVYITSNWFERSNNRRSLYQTAINNGVKLTFPENGYISERYASELFPKLGKHDVLFINNERLDIANYVKKYLIPNLFRYHTNWNGEKFKASNNLQLITLNGVNLNDQDFSIMIQYCKHVQFLDLSRNDLKFPISLSNARWGFSSLLTLNLSENPNLISIDNFREYCHKLVSINIKETSIEKFPLWLTKTNTLEEVSTDITCIFPSSVSKLTNVKKLHFKIDVNMPFNKSIMNWVELEELTLSYPYVKRDLVTKVIQDIPAKIYKMKKLKQIKFGTKWWTLLSTTFKFKSTKNNLMNEFVAIFDKTTLSGRYDHFLSKAKKIIGWDCVFDKIRNPIENHVTTIMTLQYSEIDIPFLYTMKKLRNLSIRNTKITKNITEMDLSNLLNLRKFKLMGTSRNKILISLKNIGSLNLRELTIKHCYSANIENIDLTYLKMIQLESIENVVKLPTFKKGESVNGIVLKNITLESIAPLVNATIKRYILFDKVVLLNKLSKEEEIELLNNPNISDWNKRSILLLLKTVKPKNTIRNR
jgi:hypothetical protein